MSVRLVAVTFEARDPALQAGFWARLLHREVVVQEGGARLLPGDETQVGLRFVRDTAGPTGDPRLHLHVTSARPGDQGATVERAVALGATPPDVGQLPEEGHVVLADPAGAAFCVIEFGNAFLAGCGLLGEVACDGSREVGVFWSAALGWPLVWDHDGETAVQSPAGGTKVAWGGESATPSPRRDPHRFELEVAGDSSLDAEVERLTALGATRLSAMEDVADEVRLADPDGTEFALLAVRSAPRPTS
ncbi:MAG: bleomycin resistance protein [Humibacillus sp.]|nr:bleomycin resistance protein [Humibacillus sp.]